MAVLQTGLAKSLAEDYTIDQSLRFNEASSSKLSRVQGAGNRKTWTFSCWFKRGNLATSSGADRPGLMGVPEVGGSILGDGFRFVNDSDILQFMIAGGSYSVKTTQVFRDTAAWYHFVCVSDTTQSVASNRMKFYVNGAHVTDMSGSTYPTLNYESDGVGNSGYAMTIGQGLVSTDFMDGYMAEVYFIDGTAYDADDFGETDDTTNQWKPKDAVDDLTFGTNGFYQKYAVTELADSFTDSANHSIHTVSGVDNAHTDTSVKKFGTASLQLPHTGTSNGDYLYVAPSDDWVILTGDYTWDLWAYFDSVSGTRNIINQNDANFSFIYSGGNLTVTQASTDYTFSWTPSTGTWYHLAVTRSSGSLRVFVDGDQVGSTASATESIPGTGGNGYLYIGDTPDQPTLTDQFEGYMDEIRFSNGIARWTAGFVVETAAYTADVYTLLLLHCDGSDGGTTFTDSSTTSGGRHTIFANGDVTQTRAVKKVGDSSIVFDGTGDYLSSPNSTDWGLNGTGDFTVEFWVRLNDVTATDQGIVTREDSSASDGWGMPWQTGGLGFQFRNPGTNLTTGTTGVANDTWYHIAACRYSGTIDLYLDGVSKDSVSNTTDMDDNDMNLVVGRFYSDNDNYYMTGYVDEIRISNVARYPDGTTFTPQTTEFTADANTKLLIHSDWNGGLGADSSGNFNTFTATNLVASDKMVDSPTNNFATFNPLVKPNGTLTYSEGNLKTVAGSNWNGAVSTIGSASGKWYMEFLAGTPNSLIGVIGASTERWWDGDGNPQDDATGTVLYYGYSGDKRINTADTSYGDTYTTPDIIGIALNLDDSEITFYKNGTVQDSGTAISFPANLISQSLYAFAFATYSDTSYANFGADSSFSGQKTAQGNQDGNSVGDFYYEPPSGYLALCTSNLSDPSIALPGENFNTMIWSGDDATRSMTGLGFQPDWVWIKQRDGTEQACWYDVLRGVTKFLAPSATTVEGTLAEGLTSFDSDGWTMGDDTANNGSGKTYVGWTWKGGGTGVSNTDGTNITSTVSANSTAGFSICTYSGTGTAGDSFGHGLSQAPELVIVKRRTYASVWITGSDEYTSWNYYVPLSGSATGGEEDYDFFNDTAPTASIVNLSDAGAINYDNDISGNGTYVAYCFHSVEGYSKIGTYVGTSNNDGPFIYCGFKPAFLILRAWNSGQQWGLYDDARSAYNVMDDILWPNLTSTESTDAIYAVDFVSNGFKWRGNNATMNYTGINYMYYAVAESPFKYANAR